MLGVAVRDRCGLSTPSPTATHWQRWLRTRAAGARTRAAAGAAARGVRQSTGGRVATPAAQTASRRGVACVARVARPPRIVAPDTARQELRTCGGAFTSCHGAAYGPFLLVALRAVPPPSSLGEEGTQRQSVEEGACLRRWVRPCGGRARAGRGGVLCLCLAAAGSQVAGAAETCALSGRTAVVAGGCSGPLTDGAPFAPSVQGSAKGNGRRGDSMGSQRTRDVSARSSRSSKTDKGPWSSAPSPVPPPRRCFEPKAEDTERRCG